MKVCCRDKVCCPELGGPLVRPEEVAILLFVLAIWVGSCVLFYIRYIKCLKMVNYLFILGILGGPNICKNRPAALHQTWHITWITKYFRGHRMQHIQWPLENWCGNVVQQSTFFDFPVWTVDRSTLYYSTKEAFCILWYLVSFHCEVWTTELSQVLHSESWLVCLKLNSWAWLCAAPYAWKVLIKISIW